MAGSEGTLEYVTHLWERRTPKATSFRTLVATFSTTRDACNAVSDIIAAGLLPAAMERMDGAMVRAVEDAFHLGLAPDAKALVLIELDGSEQLLDGQLAQVLAIC